MSTTPITDWIAARREFEEGVTPGPWGVTYNDSLGSRETPALWTDHPDYQDDAQPIARFLVKDDLPDAQWIADARTNYPRALAALEKVLELHHLLPGTPDCGDGCCGATDDECSECLGYWPCDTICVITEALGIESEG